jgi:hypothetical protein
VRPGRAEGAWSLPGSPAHPSTTHRSMSSISWSTYGRRRGRGIRARSRASRCPAPPRPAHRKSRVQHFHARVQLEVLAAALVQRLEAVRGAPEELGGVLGARRQVPGQQHSCRFGFLLAAEQQRPFTKAGHCTRGGCPAAGKCGGSCLLTSTEDSRLTAALWMNTLPEGSQGGGGGGVRGRVAAPAGRGRRAGGRLQRCSASPTRPSLARPKQRPHSLGRPGSGPAPGPPARPPMSLAMSWPLMLTLPVSARSSGRARVSLTMPITRCS